MDLITEITIFVLAAFVGFEVISKVPTTLHTPLMSQTNAIHGIVMLGGLIVVGFADDGLEKMIGLIAIVFGTINIVGGFLVTDRMLAHVRPQAAEHRERPAVRLLGFASGGGRVGRRMTVPVPVPSAVLEPGGDVATLLYIVSFSLLHLRRSPGTHPTTAKQGNLIAAGGMAIAVTTTLLLDGIGNWGLIVAGIAIGTAVGRDRLDPGADDPDAADGRALQRRRRRRRGADRLVGVRHGISEIDAGCSPRSRSTS